MSQDNRHAQSDESWMKDQLTDDEQPNTDFIKLRMHIEIQEQWLREQLAAEVHGFQTADCRQELNKRVRQEIASIQPKPSRLPRRRIKGWSLWVGGALASAAAVVMFISMPQKNADIVPADPIALEGDSTVWLSAFESFSEDSFSTQLSVIDREIHTLDNALATLDSLWAMDDWSTQSSDFDESDSTNTDWLDTESKILDRVESGT